MSVSSLFLEPLADLLDDFIKDVDDIFVSSIAVSRAMANCCVISKFVQCLMTQGSLIVLFKKTGAKMLLKSRADDVQIPRRLRITNKKNVGSGRLTNLNEILSS